LPGLLTGCIAAHAVTVLLLRRSILTEKVARRGHHLTREYSVDLLEVLRVGEVMDTEAPTVPATMKVTDLAEKMTQRSLHTAARQCALIVNAAGKLVGIITLSDVLRALEAPADSEATVLDAGSADLIVAYEDEVLREAVARMLRNDIGRLPVVSRQDAHQIVGYLDRSRVMAARQRRFEEEHVRERHFPLRTQFPWAQ